MKLIYLNSFVCCKHQKPFETFVSLEGEKQRKKLKNGGVFVSTCDYEWVGAEEKGKGIRQTAGYSAGHLKDSWTDVHERGTKT